MTSVAATNKGRVTLRYDRPGKLAGVDYRGKDPADVGKLLLLAGWLYCLRAASVDAFRESVCWAFLGGIDQNRH